ncbi:MAG: flagellar biosynthesis protein FlhB [Alphaproteobacteria bacterium]
MAEDTDDSQKTEEPTSKKLEDARKKGQVAASREVSNLFMISAGTLVLIVFGPGMFRDLGAALLKFVEAPDTIPTDSEHLRIVLLELMREVGLAIVVPILVFVAAAVGGGLVQNGMVVAADRIMPKLERISIQSGLSRLFSRKALVEFAKGVLKVSVVAAVVTMLVYPQFKGLPSFTGLEIGAVLDVVRRLSAGVFIDVLAIVAAIAAVDFLYQRFEFRKSMRMSKQEVRDEFKQTEGDPMIKSRLRQIRVERARRRMMAAVPEADVVVTNPTHYAVALKYEPAEMAAPKVVAKGVDSLAKRIREVAEDNDVVVMENPPLAQALYATVDLDEEIPAEHYKAVAEIIGYVFRLKKKVIAR